MATTLFQKHTKIDDLCLVLNSYLPHSEIELVKLAYKMANKAHSGQFRKSGEHYIHHPTFCALILADLKLDYFVLLPQFSMTVSKILQ